MDSMQEEMDDSRISAVSRKRNLEEIQDHKSDTSRHSSPEDDALRAFKHVKDDDEPPEGSFVEDGIILNTSSPLHVASPSLPAESSETLTTNSQPPPTLAAPLRAGAWNRGVQSGVRTSFGNRVQTRSKLKSTPIVPSPKFEANHTSNAIADTTTLPQKGTHISSDDDEGADTTMAETTENPETQISDPPSSGEGEDFLMAQTDGRQMQTGTTSEEEGEISSSRGATEDVDMLHEEPSVPFGRYAGGESSLFNGAVSNANSLQQQSSRIFQRDNGQPSGNFFGIDLQRQETIVRAGSGSPDARDVRDRSDAGAANADASPVWKWKAVNALFTKLSAAEEAQLTVVEKAKYLTAKNDWFREQKMQNTLSEKTNAFKRTTAEAEDMEDDTASASQPNDLATAPFRLLTSLEVARLSAEQRSAYKHAKRIHQREEKYMDFENRTSEAEAVLTHEALPLPEKYKSVESDISNGLTFFPRRVDETRQVYRKFDTDFKISEVFKDGKPIRLQHFRFNIFAPAFLRDNPDTWAVITKKELSAAFSTYLNLFYSHVLHIGKGLHHAARSSSAPDAIAVEEAQRIAKLSNPRSVDEQPQLPDNKPEFLPDDITEVDLNQEHINDMERKLQEKYFPSAVNRPASYHCLVCGDSGHKTVDCPSMTCTLCGGDHVRYACPQSRRCHKCRQRGHDIAQCPEKLALSKAEAIGCDFCGSKDHFEIGCHTIWRTFHPKPEEIRKVRDIPVHCYICGGEGHYGPVCGLYKECPLLSGGETWSSKNLIKYLDASSNDRAISAGVDYSITSKPTKQFSIKGKSNNPIDLDESDDDSTTFLHEKVKGPKHHRQIKIAGTARFAQLPQQTNFPRAPNPPRDSRPDFDRNTGRNGPSRAESARYGGERTLSTPPRPDDMRYGFQEAEDNFRPQAPQRENFYRPRPPQAQNNYQSAPQGPLPVRQPSTSLGNASRGGHTGRGGRAQNGGNNAQSGGGGVGEGQPKKKKKFDRGGRGGARRGN